MKNQAGILAHLVVAVTIVLHPTGLQHSVLVSKDMVPTRTGKMGRHFPVREKSGNLNKYWESQGISSVRKSGNHERSIPQF